MEYLNPRSLKAFIPRLFITNPNKKNHSIDEYIMALQNLRTSKDGFFGIQAQPNHLVRIFKNQEDAKKNSFFNMIILF